MVSSECLAIGYVQEVLVKVIDQWWGVLEDFSLAVILLGERQGFEDFGAWRRRGVISIKRSVGFGVRRRIFVFKVSRFGFFGCVRVCVYRQIIVIESRFSIRVLRLVMVVQIVWIQVCQGYWLFFLFVFKEFFWLRWGLDVWGIFLRGVEIDFLYVGWQCWFCFLGRDGSFRLWSQFFYIGGIFGLQFLVFYVTVVFDFRVLRFEYLLRLGFLLVIGFVVFVFLIVVCGQSYLQQQLQDLGL